MKMGAGHSVGNSHLAQYQKGGAGSAYPAITSFPCAKHFFPILESSQVGVHSDLTCALTGLVMTDIVLPRNCGNTYYEAANEGDEGAFLDGGDWYVDRGVPDCVQPDISGSPTTKNTSQPWTNLGTKDFLMLSVGHQLTFGVSGTSIHGMGNPTGDGVGNTSRINMVGTAGGDDPVVLEDTGGNQVTMPSTTLLTAGPPHGHSNFPYLCAIWREGNTLYRRIKVLHTGEEEIDRKDMSHISGDIQPGAAFFWYDWIPYGFGVFGFEAGIPKDIHQGCDWMADDWRFKFSNKTFYPPWAALL